MTTPDDEWTEPAERPLLIDIHALAALLDRSAASLERDLPAGRLPAPVWLGGSRRWRRAEIVAWVDAGCPNQTDWEELRHE